MAFELFPFQKEGVKFLKSKDCALLADDMGLGKTIQAITAARELSLRRVLVICPLAVRHTWYKAVAELMPYINAKEIRRASKYVPVAREWVFVNYDLVWRDPLQAGLSGAEWDLVICDESHFLKSVKSKRTTSVLSQSKGVTKKAIRVWLLTGTPILNRPVELYPIMRALFETSIADCLGYFDFTKKFCKGRQGTFGWDATGASNIDELKRRLSPYMLRRMKEEVFSQMPKATFTPLYLEPSKIMAKTLERERALSGVVETLADRAERLSVGEVGSIRRQIGCDKIGFAVSYLEETTEKTVVFTFHRDVANGIHQSMMSSSVLYTGEQTQAQKAKALEDFINGDKQFFIAQIKAAGTGIDGLQKVCCNAVFVELCYVPGEIDQAIDRLVRIGQTKPVTVNVLVHEGSLDEDILKKLDKKREVIGKIVGDRDKEDLIQKLKDLGVL